MANGLEEGLGELKKRHADRVPGRDCRRPLRLGDFKSEVFVILSNDVLGIFDSVADLFVVVVVAKLFILKLF